GIERHLQDVGRLHQLRGAMPRDEIAVRILRIADADVSERIDNAFVGENAVGNGQFVAQFGEGVGHGWFSSSGVGWGVEEQVANCEQRVANESLTSCHSAGGGWSYQAHPILPRRSANLSLTFCRSSGLARATMGKSARRSNGRQASMMARELVELALSSMGSS